MEEVNREVTTYQNIDPKIYSNGVGVLGKKSSWQKTPYDDKMSAR